MSKLRSSLYRTARALGDFESVGKAVRTRSGAPLARRAKNRLLGRITGRILRKL